MFDAIQPALAVIGIVLVVLAAVGSAAAYLRASYAKATVTTLGESNAALKEQVEILKADREEDDRERTLVAAKVKAHTDDLSARLGSLERENLVLKDVVQGKADLDRLVMLIQDHHHEVIEDRRAFHAEWRSEIDKILSRLYATSQGISENVTTLAAVNANVAQVKGLLTRAATGAA